MSVLRYPGGKTRAVKIYDKIIQEYGFDISTIISPFFGGGSVELYLHSKYASRIIANDKFMPLMTFWVALQSDRNKTIEEISKLHPITKETFYKIRQYINNWTLTDGNYYQVASFYFAVNRSSFSGSTCSGGYSIQASKDRFTQSSIDKLLTLDLNNIIFYSYDFVDFLLAQDDKTFIFLDPPYYLGSKSKLYGQNGNLHEDFDHDKLSEILKQKKNWILCYNDCHFIREKYQSYKIIDLKWAYGMNKSKKSSEILIISK